MKNLRLMSTTPKRINPRVRQLLEAMGLQESLAQWLPLCRSKTFQPELSECHINSWIQSMHEGGAVCTGWTIWQDRNADFVEAQFHTVWKDRSGILRDITPRQDKERNVLFVPDVNHEVTLTNTIHGPAVEVFDNVRMQSGVLTNLFSRHVRVLKTDLILKYNLVGYFQKYD